MTSHTADGLRQLLQGFVDDTAGVTFAQTMSADGMHLAASDGYDEAQSDTFAAITSGLASLAASAVEAFELGSVAQQIIEASDGWILVSRVSGTAAVGVVLEAQADLGMVGYELTLLAKQLADVLSPELLTRLKNSLVMG